MGTEERVETMYNDRGEIERRLHEDICQPIRILINACQMSMAAGRMGREWQERLEQVETESYRMLRLVEDVIKNSESAEG